MVEAVHHDGRCVAKTLRWDDMPVKELSAFVSANYSLLQRGQQPSGAMTWHDREADPAWQEWVKQTFADAGFGPVEQYKWWLSKFNHQSRRKRADTTWLEGFPHKHSWPHGVTLVLMVQPSESGGETVLIEDDGTEHELSLQAGEAVLIGGELEHGVRPIGGRTERLVLISTAFVAKGIQWNLQ